MLDNRADYPLKESLAIFHLSNMFALGDRYAKRHTDMKLFELGFCYGGKHITSMAEDFEVRHQGYNSFVDLCRDNGYELNRRNFTTTTTYFTSEPEEDEVWFDRFKQWKNAVTKFAEKESDRVLIWTGHFCELEPNMRTYTRPHVHVVYSIKPTGEFNVYKDFMDSYIITES